MNYRQRIKGHRHGLFLTEVLISLALLTMLIAGLAIAQKQASQFNSLCLLRQRCVAAAQAQLDSIATETPLSKERIGLLWPDVSLKVKQQPGSGQWSKMDLISVTASATAKEMGTQITLNRYVSRKQETAK